MLPFYKSYAKCEIPKKFVDEIYDDNGKIEIINKLSKVNVFLGSNNSGKSQIIRELIRREPKNLYYSDDTIYEIKELLFESLDKIKELLASHGIPDINFRIKLINNPNDYGVHYTISEIKSTNFELPNFIIQNLLDQLILLPKIFDQFPINPTPNILILNQQSQFYDIIPENSFRLLKEVTQILKATCKQLEKFHFFNKSGFCRVYIPSSRTLRDYARKINIKQSTQIEYGFDNSIFIENGQELFSQIRKLKNNSSFTERKKITDFELFLSLNFFQAQKIELITPDNKDSADILYIKIGNEKDQPIHNLGDGLQMIIILTFPFFIYANGFIAIEEPELFIHPGLQKKLIDFFLNHQLTENFQILISTHSNHIIDSINSSNKISLFNIKKKYKDKDSSFEKLPDFVITNVAYGNDNIFSSLGISNTSVYLSNCVIWVEGVTDRLYFITLIKEYLNSQKIVDKHKVFLKYQEGVNFSFAFTGGDSIIHWDFDETEEYTDKTIKIITSRFCGKSLVVIDNDFNKNKKRKEELKKLLGNRIIELNVPEIENLLSQEVIKKVIVEYPSCNKIDTKNLPILSEKLIKENKIGTLIDQYLLKSLKGVKKFSAKQSDSRSASLKSQDKVEFCKRCLPHINPSNLTNESIKVVKKILDFVISQNKYTE